MSDTLAEDLMKYGIDYVDAIDRFDNNADLYKRMAIKYLNDTHYADLVAAMEVKDFEEGYRQAHSLKGVAGNLSFPDLFKLAAIVSDALYDGEIEGAQAHMGELGDAHAKVIEGLMAWSENAF